FGNNLVPNGSFVHGDLRGWKDVPGNWGLIQRGSDPSSAIQNAPTQWVLYMDQAASARTAVIAENVPVKGGEQLSWEIEGAVTGASGIADIEPQFNWKSSSGLPLTPTIADGGGETDDPTWTIIGGDVTAPMNAASVDILIRRGPGGAGRAVVTN